MDKKFNVLTFISPCSLFHQLPTFFTIQLGHIAPSCLQTRPPTRTEENSKIDFAAEKHINATVPRTREMQPTAVDD